MYNVGDGASMVLVVYTLVLKIVASFIEENESDACVYVVEPNASSCALREVKPRDFGKLV